MNSIQAVIVCQNNGQRNVVVNAANRYADQHGISDDPVALSYDGNKYGNGPACIIMAWFDNDRAGADVAWADFETAITSVNVQSGSYMLQSENDSVIHHVVWNPDRTVLV